MATEDRKPPVPTEESPPKTPPEEAERTRIITPPPLPADSDTPTRAIPRVQQPQSWDAMTVPMARQTPPPAAPPAKPKRKRRPIAWTSLFFGLAATVVGLFFVALLASMIGYIYIASELPPVEELRSRQLTFASSRIYDRDGRLLYEMIDPTGGRRTYVHYGDISPYVIQATIATEDRNFFQHPGFDPIAIARAIYYALQEQEVVSGASTITQQVARNLLLEPEERVEQTVSRKIREIVLAAEITRRYSREEILEIYLNNINYGNLAYGIDAAARTYFGATADNLTLAQASFLAGIPQLPATYDPFGGGREAALTRHENVLRLMVEDGHITAAQAQAATEEMRAHEFRPIFTDRIPAAHFVVYVRQWVEENLGPELLYQGNGLRIHTTLDQQMQAIGEEEVANGVARLAERNVSNGSLVAIEPATGYILAMVGSVDFYNNEIGGQVNVNLRCRQPGSAIKPLTYLGAFEQGWTPATILWDLPVTYTDTAGNIYEPLNYDRQFRGPVSLRSALANSLNVPAVKTLEFIGVNELLDISARLGATSIVSPQLECPEYPLTSRPLYGLALTLGGGEMKPLELTAAYATFANGGEAFAPTPILWIEDSEGRILVDNRVRTGEQVISPQDAYLITDILSDTEARCLVFSC
ncbi:MAG TPA: hypothetical protein ENN14_01375, partial [Chloroflexi bacterium]|nr:hypothetical protein [Chloroflexota bacterium]